MKLEQDLLDNKDVALQVEQEKKPSTSRKPREETCIEYCSNCRETGHNTCTSQIVIEVSEEEDSE